jgi:hypothetical protein
MTGIRRLLASRLSLQKRIAIRAILNGLKQLVASSEESASSVDSRLAGLLARPLSVDDLVEAIDLASITSDAANGQELSRLLLAVMLRPANWALLETPLLQRKYAKSVGYRRLYAAYAHGRGQAGVAFKEYCDLHDEFGGLTDFMLAAHCLMRPDGNEQQALDFLLSGEAAYSNEPFYLLNLATAYYVVGQTASANEVLERNRGLWEGAVGVGSDAAVALEKELASALENRIVARHTHYDDTIYSEAAIWAHWAPYYADMELDPKHLMFGWLARAYEEFIEAALGCDAGVDAVVDFGVMCAVPHARIARRRSQMAIVGVDRQRETAQLNQLAFGDLKNLSFVAAEIESYLDAASPKMRNGVLFHARTATLCYPEKIRQLYAKARDKGVRHIVLFENVALSRSAGKFLDFDDFLHDAVTFKNHQFIHNYVKLLDEAGYKVVEQRRFFSPLVAPLSIDDLGSTHIMIRARLAD